MVLGLLSNIIIFLHQRFQNLFHVLLCTTLSWPIIEVVLSLIDRLGKRNRDPAPFHRLTPNKRFEPVFSTVIMAVCNRMLLLTDLIPVHLVYCGQTVMIGYDHTSFEWTRAVRHIYGIIRHMQGLY